MNETSTLEAREIRRGITLSDEIYSVEPDPDEDRQIEISVEYHDEESSKDDWRETLKNAAEAGRDDLRHWNLLVDTVQRSGYESPIGRDTVVLDIGCGTCEEARTLNSFLVETTFQQKVKVLR